MKAGVVVFPGTNCDRDTFEACREFGWDAQYIWHDEIDNICTVASPSRGEADFQRERNSARARKSGEGGKDTKYLNNFDIIFLPGGFSYGDYIRSGRLAKFSPIIEALKNYIEQKRGFVVGICNGFQILCEAQILPGVLTYNENLKFICKDVECEIQNTNITCHCEERGTSDAAIQKNNENTENWIASLHFSNAPRNDTNNSQTLTLPIAHAEGRYFADEKTLQTLKEKNMIFLTYVYNPNGSMENIAGIYDREKRVLGMMPHPERAFFKETGNLDGHGIFEFIERECN